MNPIPHFNVLLLSTSNSARSILAEYILSHHAKGRFGVSSAGLRPCRRVDPITVRVLNDRYGIDARAARSKSWEEFSNIEFDFIITVCDHARDAHLPWKGRPVMAHWGSPHPADLAMTEEGRYQATIDVASQIAARSNLFCSFPDEKLVRAAWDAGTSFPFPLEESEPVTHVDTPRYFGTVNA